jgi:hypothetical protein
MATFQITNPFGETFAVVVKNSALATVYAASHGNEVFDTGIITPGDYTMYIDGGTTPVYCFTVSACECPVLEQVGVTLVSGSYYGVFTFDMAGGFPCPFKMEVTTAFTSGTFTIDSLSDLDFVSGTLYSKTFIIGGVGAMSYTISTIVEGAESILCYEGAESYDCTSPVVQTVSLRQEGTCDTTRTFFIDVAFTGVTGSCPVTANFTQITPTSTYTGTDGVTLTVDGTWSIPISPTSVGVNQLVRFSVSVTDCCGVVTTRTATLTTDCEGPTIPPTLSLVLVGSIYYMRAVYVDCGACCNGANFSWVQNNVLTSGVNDTGVNNSNNIDCDAIFPLTIDYPLAPNLSISPSETDIRYYINFTNCCNEVSFLNLITIARP